jgi:hypothetical protein
MVLCRVPVCLSRSGDGLRVVVCFSFSQPLSRSAGRLEWWWRGSSAGPVSGCSQRSHNERKGTFGTLGGDLGKV